jgi:hypothetical protein
VGSLLNVGVNAVDDVVHRSPGVVDQCDTDNCWGGIYR